MNTLNVDSRQNIRVHHVFNLIRNLALRQAPFVYFFVINDEN